MGNGLIVLIFRSSTERAQLRQSACWLVSPQVGRWVVQAHPQPARRPAMIRLTRLPEEVARLLAPLKPYFSYRHYLVFCGLLVAHLVCFEKAPGQGLARYTHPCKGLLLTLASPESVRSRHASAFYHSVYEVATSWAREGVWCISSCRVAAQ